MKRHLIKVGAATVAFVPIVILLLNYANVLKDSPLVTGAVFFNLPALSLSMAIDTVYHPDEKTALALLLFVMVLWASLVSVVFWKFAKMFLSEGELGGGKFDWVAFQVRFFCGFVIGFLFGWRFVKYSDGSAILICMTITGIIGGLILGAWHENFWRR